MLEIVASDHKFTTDSVFPDTIQWFGHYGWLKAVAFWSTRRTQTTKLVYVDPQCCTTKLGHLIFWRMNGWVSSYSLVFHHAKVSQFHPKFSFQFGFLGGKGFDGFRCVPPSSFLTFSVKIWAGLASQKATFSLTIGQNQDVATADVTLVRHDASGWTTNIQNNPRRNDLNWWQEWDDSNRWQELGV